MEGRANGPSLMHVKQKGPASRATSPKAGPCSGRNERQLHPLPRVTATKVIPLPPGMTRSRPIRPRTAIRHTSASFCGASSPPKGTIDSGQGSWALRTVPPTSAPPLRLASLLWLLQGAGASRPALNLLWNFHGSP